MRPILPLALLGALLVAVLALACCQHNTPASLRNDSALRLHDVHLSGPGFSVHPPTLGPGEQHDLSVPARGEGALTLRFSAAGQLHAYGPVGYVEGGGLYRIDLRITPNLSQIDRSGLRTLGD